MIKKLLQIFFVPIILVFSQTKEEVDKLFNQAVKDYKNKNYSSALVGFNKITNDFKINSKSSLSLLFAAKTNLELKNYSEAERLLQQFSKQFSSSKYADDANFTLSKLYFEQKKYLESFYQLIHVLENSNNADSKSFSKIKAEKIALNYLTAEDIKACYDTTGFTNIKPFMLLLCSKNYVEQRNRSAAQQQLKKLIDSYPKSSEYAEARKLYDELIRRNDMLEQADIVGVLLPLTSSAGTSETAAEILEGIKYSISEFNSGRENKIGILFRDTELDKNKLKEIHDEFIEIDGLRCIIGPIYSSEVKDALDVFSDTNIPMVSPTATDDYLTDLDKNFFQANPSFSSRGRLMAQYVYFTCNKRKIAILNSIDGYSPVLSTNFSQEFEKLGGKIIVRESYKSGSVTLKDQMKKLFEYQNQIDGFYIPLADKSDIPVIISFLSQFNLTVPIYGDQDWMISSGLESASFLNNNLIFCSDYFIRYDEPDYQNFSKNFYAKTNTAVNRNVLYGYDTMKFILTIMRSSLSGASSIRQKMISGIMSAGFHNNICFDSNRINRYLNIIRYSNGKFELIDKFKLNN